MSDHMTRLRERSGKVSLANPLVSFLYELMRDHVTPGKVEEIMTQTETSDPEFVTAYSNGWLADYAKDVADRLLGGDG